MMISNRCILPDGWTVDTLMQPHDSIPYNPDIAGVFYRAGYIERWGRGIQKICESCKELGEELPQYEIIGNSIRVSFKALESAVITQPKHQDGGLNGGEMAVNGGEMAVIGGETKRKILAAISSNNKISTTEISKITDIPKRTVERYIRELKDEGNILRHGSARGGYWEITKQ